MNKAVSMMLQATKKIKHKESKCDNPPRKVPYYCLRPTHLVIKQ
jgi:hypothetical protein